MRLVTTAILCTALAAISLFADEASIGDDLKTAGKASGRAAKNSTVVAGKAIGNGAVALGKALGRGSRKVTNFTAGATAKGAGKLEEKTR